MLVTVGQENGIGGRNREWALSAARIAGIEHIVMGAVDSDGTDGGKPVRPGATYPTLAGGLVDGFTFAEARSVGWISWTRCGIATPGAADLDSGILPQSPVVDLGLILVTGRQG